MQKYRIQAFSLLLGITLFFNLQCERTLIPVDESEKVEYVQGNIATRVIMTVLDRHTSEPLADAMVNIIGLNSAKTNSSGIVAFDSVVAGAYLVSCTKSGYEGTYDQFSLSLDSNSNTVPVLNQSIDVFFMSKKGVTVRGNLYYKDESRHQLANDATIECQLIGTTGGYQKPIVTTTSDDGSYTITGLPEYVTYSISVLPFTASGVSYKQAAALTVSGRAANDTVRADDIVLQKFTDGTFIVLAHNLKTFTRTDSIIFEFSEAVDREKLNADSIYVTIGSISARMLIKQIWKDNDKKLCIIPYDGAWEIGVPYVLSMRKLQSVKGKPLNNAEFITYNFTPTVNGDLGKVEDVRFRVGSSDTIKVDYNTSSVTLLWSELEGAASYQIYQKATEDSSWYLANSTADTTITLATSSLFLDGGQLEIMVLAKNSSSMSSFEDATKLTLKDTRKPVISATTSYTGFNRTTIHYIDTLEFTISSYLPEPMDTTKKPSFKVVEAGYVSGATLYGDTLYKLATDAISWKWTSDRAGVLSVVVDSVKNASYDTLKIDFSPVPDVAGNTPDTTAGRGTITIFTRP